MRHPGLATLWFLSLGVSLLSFVAPVLFALPMTPVLALVSADAVARRRASERQSAGWRGVHRLVMSLLVVAAAIGMVVLAVSPIEPTILTALPAMALVFLSSVIVGIRALAVASPFRAALPAIIAHVPMALVMTQSLVAPEKGPHDIVAFGPGVYPWAAVLVLSTLASIVSLVGFDGAVADEVPSARVRS